MRRPVRRRGFLAALGATALAGCSGDPGRSSSPAPTTGTPTARRETPTEDPTEVAATGPPTADERLPLPLEPAEISERALSGGPPKDGIPSIDEPTFELADAASERLAPGDPVFGVATEDRAKAYPQSVLVWHEICNDTIGETPVSVTYCPLTGTAMGFHRGETTFGVSGRLVHNNLIMYDRATETWWPQVLATAVPGPWNDSPETASLRPFPVVWTTWERWREAHPRTWVLTEETSVLRNYDRDPYGSYNPVGGYYADDADPLFPTLSTDARLPPKRVVVGARTAAGAAAFEKDRLRNAKVVPGQLGDAPVVAVYDRRLDTGHVYRNPEGADFGYQDGSFVSDDGDTYRPDALPLAPVVAFDAMWFAWSGFYPDTTRYA